MTRLGELFFFSNIFNTVYFKNILQHKTIDRYLKLVYQYYKFIIFDSKLTSIDEFHNSCSIIKERINHGRSHQDDVALLMYTMSKLVLISGIM